MKRTFAALLILLALAAGSSIAWGKDPTLQKYSYSGMIDIDTGPFVLGALVGGDGNPQGAPPYVYFPLGGKGMDAVFNICEVGDICTISGQAEIQSGSGMFYTIEKVVLVEKLEAYLKRVNAESRMGKAALRETLTDIKQKRELIRKRRAEM